MSAIVVIYAAVGCVYWLAMVVGAIRTVRGVPKLSQGDPPEPGRWPRLSVVVPACNEAASIAPAASTLLAQDYSDFEVVLVDDRSNDGTGEAVDRIAEGDGRVVAIHVTELPDGWLGKVHALDTGLQRSSGEWVLFTDADVHFAPGSLRRAIAWAEHRGLDHLAVMPHLRSASPLVDALVTVFLRTFAVSLRLWNVEDPRSVACAGVGAFNLVRRRAFLQTPGFEWLRLEVADDMGLGLMMKRFGARSGFANGVDLVGVHWYQSLHDMARGAEKGFASIADCRVTGMLAVSLMLGLTEWSPLVALLPWGVPWLWLAGLAMVVMWITSDVILQRWARRPIWPSLLMPLASLVGVVLLLRTAWLGFIRGGALWRGTLYPSRVLRQGKRLRLGALVSGRRCQTEQRAPTA